MSSPDNSLPEGDLIPPPLSPVQPAVDEIIENPPWTIAEVFLIAAVTLVFTFVLQFAAVGVALHFHPGAKLDDLAKSAKVIMPAQFLTYALVLVAMAMLLRSRGLRFWRNLRWTM